ncbi:MAG: aminopeptidase P N-terminal domain-containing protein, partial [Mycobacteriales bacterium]
MTKRKTPKPLVELMAHGWAPPGELGTAAVLGAVHHARARAVLSAAFQGQTVVIPTGAPKIRNNDVEYDFRPGSDFAYLTGHYEPDAVLILSPSGDATAGHTPRLYLRSRADRGNPEFFTSYHGELWSGPRLTLREQQARLGLPCAELAELPDVLADLDPATTTVLRGVHPSVDKAVKRLPKKAGNRDAELAQTLAELRLIKDSWELEQLDDAIGATIRGFEDVVRALPADRPSPERLVDGVFGLRARCDGNYVGYGTIAAAGAHACTLHWERNTGQC